MLFVYLAELEEDIPDMSDKGEPVKEIRTVSDYIMRTAHCSSESTGQTMGMAVVALRR